jgi:hypothetical protein
MKKAFTVLDKTPLISNESNGVTRQTVTYQIGDNKFRIHYENSNGRCMGFNSDMCLKQYSKNDAKWNNLEDIRMLNMSTPIPGYYAMRESITHMNEFFKKMEERMVKIYS